MKKFLSLIAIAAVMMVGLAGNAMAYFEDNHLIRIIYQTNGSVELASDLGLFTDALNSTNTALGDSFSLSQFSSASYSDLQVAYVVGGFTAQQWYLSGEADNAPVSGTNKGTTLRSAWLGVDSYYGSSSSTVVKDKNAVTSYYTKMDFGNILIAGTFAGFYADGMGEANLADLATVGYVDQVMYNFPTATLNSALEGTAVATIRTWADGTTTIVPSAATVPLPASVLLFGSGLLGLFGIRRKNA